MRSPINISIPEPCGESWQNMTPVQGGRHCDVCEKCIVDFTQSSDKEIWKAYQKEGKICGQFRADQLNRLIATPREKRVPMGIAVALALTTSTPSAAQESNSQTTVCTPKENKTEASISISSVDTTKPHFKGYVYSLETNEPIPFTTVLLYSKGDIVYSTLVDFDGHYAIPHSLFDSTSVDQLCITMIGYEDQIWHFDSPLHSLTEFENVVSMKTSMEVGLVEATLGIVVVRKAPWYKRLWWRIKRPFH
jgi:hypothetical protein